MKTINLEINQSWSFEDIVNNLEALRNQFDDFLTLFSFKTLHQKNEFVRSTRCKIYSLNFVEWKKDMIWGYLNHYEPLYPMKQMVNRQKKKKMIK